MNRLDASAGVADRARRCHAQFQAPPSVSGRWKVVLDHDPFR
jgi:hypothetical protein